MVFISRRMFYVVCWVFVIGLFSSFTFGWENKRTYLGKDSGDYSVEETREKDSFTNPRIEEIRGDIREKERGVNKETIVGFEQKRSEREEAALRGGEEDIPARGEMVPESLEEVGDNIGEGGDKEKEVERLPQSEARTISSEHIPMGGKYTMIGEPMEK